ncbi:hypothetical protein ACFXA3_35565 [Streptomyces sp. NPDC059456]|uniref:hypothetical protein n=1 Tax=Streptomyces sp. NPDC059456 TaxID=3346838 RepID=UPI0036A61537
MGTAQHACETVMVETLGHATGCRDAGFAQIEKAASGAGIGTLELLALVAPNLQFVDADFAGFAGDELRVVLREFDSTSWDFGTADASLVREFCRYYPDAAPTPEDVLQQIPWQVDQGTP